MFAFLCFVAAVAFAASPILTPGFNGFTPDQFPVPQVDPPVQPAGWAFSIWGVIYLWLIVGTGFGLFARADVEDWRDARIWLFASLGPGVAWLAVAQISVVWATVLIWAMALTAIAALLAAGSDDRWFQRSGVALYAGWLTAASSVSIGLLLAGYGVMEAVPAALVALLIALGVALMVQTLRQDTPEYAIAVIWALSGVIASNLSPVQPIVVGFAAAGIVVLGLRAVRRG